LERGIREDLENGSNARRADKLLDRAYIEMRVGRLDLCMSAVKEALDLDRSAQRMLSAGAILSEAGFATHGQTKTLLRAQLRSIADTAQWRDLHPLFEILEAPLRGQVFLAAGEWTAGLSQLKKADAFEPRAADRTYLADAYLAAAQSTKDRRQAAAFLAQARLLYAAITAQPAQVWQWAVAFPPGYSSDALLSLAKATLLSGEMDSVASQALEEYAKRRSKQDAALQALEHNGTIFKTAQSN
jgi:hypothetical protein